MEAGRELLSICFNIHREGHQGYTVAYTERTYSPYNVAGHLNEFYPGSTNRDPKYVLECLQSAQGLSLTDETVLVET